MDPSLEGLVKQRYRAVGSTKDKLAGALLLIQCPPVRDRRAWPSDTDNPPPLRGDHGRVLTKPGRWISAFSGPRLSMPTFWPREPFGP